MLLAAVGFLYQQIELLLFVLFLMGAQSAFFGPIKYSYLPQVMNEAELVRANALFQLGTFLAILVGTITGGVLIASSENGAIITSAAVVSLALLGAFTAIAIPPVRNYPEVRIDRNPFGPTIETIKIVRKNRTIFLSILGMTWFWFFGAALLALFPAYGKDYLYSNEHVVTFFLSLFSIGIGVGSVLCNKLSGKKLELGLVPIGCFGMTVAAVDLYFATPNSLVAPDALHDLSSFLQLPGSWRIAFDLFFISASGGLFIIPLLTLIQERSPKESLSRVIAGLNILNALGMVLSSMFLLFLHSLELAIPTIFLCYGVINLLVGIYIFLLIPEFTLRFCVWVLSKIIYKVTYKKKNRLPETGAAVLVCNHISYVDWLIIQSASRRPIRFVMHYRFLQIPMTGWLFSIAGVIPIASQKDNPEVLQAAMDEIEQVLARGELLCIFPEGTLTKDGEIGEFRRGIERIVEKSPAPVVPMALSGMWESLFARNPQSKRRRIRRRLRAAVELAFGSALEPGRELISAEDLRIKVSQLRTRP